MPASQVIRFTLKQKPEFFMSNQATPEQLQTLVLAAYKWLNQNHPTHGDGWWSPEYIEAVYHGGYFGDKNRLAVLQALIAAEREMELS